MQTLDIWNFYGSLTLSNGELVENLEGLDMLLCVNMTHFDISHSVWNERKMFLFEVHSSFSNVSIHFSFHVSTHF